MDLKNVQLWFAKNSKNEIVTIDKVNKDNGEKYYCPLCGSEVIPRQGEINAWCFAHIDKSNCTSESMIHWWFKNKFIEHGDKFVIKADESKEYTCKEIIVEKEYEFNDKKYKPDITVITEDGETIFFEMNYTNSKKIEDYLDVWVGLKNIVVEVDIKQLMTLDNIPEFKTLYYKGKMYNMKKEDKVYRETIGKLKLKNTNFYKERIKKLDWLWKDIHKYKKGELSIESVSNDIKNIDIEDRTLAVNILKGTNCQHVIDDFVKYNNNIFLKHLNSIKFKDVIVESGLDVYIKNSDEYRQYDKLYSSGVIIDIYNKYLHNKIFNLKTFDTENNELIKIMDICNNLKELSDMFEEITNVNAIIEKYPLIEFVMIPHITLDVDDDKYRFKIKNMKNSNSNYQHDISVKMPCSNNEFKEVVELAKKRSEFINEDQINLIYEIITNLNNNDEDCKMIINVQRMKIIRIYIEYKERKVQVYSIKKYEYNDLNKLKSNIEESIICKINDIEKKTKIKELTNKIKPLIKSLEHKLNNKYKSVNSDWSISLYDYIEINETRISITAFNNKRRSRITKDVEINSNDIIINFNNTANLITNKLCDSIRESIYNN